MGGGVQNLIYSLSPSSPPYLFLEILHKTLKFILPAIYFLKIKKLLTLPFSKILTSTFFDAISNNDGKMGLFCYSRFSLNDC